MATTPINNFLSAPLPTSTTQLLKPKEAAVGSTDFSSQLKDAQQAQDKPAPAKADAAKPVRREAGKGGRTSTKSKTAKSVRRQANAQGASEDTTVEPKADTPQSATAEAPHDDSPEDSTDGAPDKSPVEKAAAADLPQADPTQAVTPTFVLQTPPPGFTAIQNARLEKFREEFRRGAPAGGPPKVEPFGTEAKPTDQPAADTASTDAKPAGPTEKVLVDADVAALPDDAVPPVVAKTVAKAPAAQTAANATAAVANLVGDAATAAPPATPDIPVADDSNVATDAIGSLLSTPVNSQHSPALKSTAADTAAPSPREAQFAEANHANIVSALRTNLLPHGGTMEIRLDPPELGALQVSVEMRNGTINATFQTSNDDATRLLGHSLGQLKTALESQGVTVDKIQVQQAPRDQQARGDSSQQQQQNDSQARQDQQREQQRREMLERMWQRISGAPMPVDLVA